MNAVIVYESDYGNMRAVADAVAEGLGGATVVPIHQAAGRVAAADLLVVGVPTRIHGLATERSRQMATAAAHENGGISVDADATETPDLRRWVYELRDRQGAHAATFDARMDKSPWFTGVASRGIARRMRRHGYDLVGSESFLVEDSEAPLEQGELERARWWGAQLADAVPSNGSDRRPSARIAAALLGYQRSNGGLRSSGRWARATAR